MPLSRASSAIAAMIASGIAAHVDAPDPHPQYARTGSGALRLPVLDADPAPPATGALLYLFTTGTAYELRIIDSLGVVETIGP
jgi:hypothetical protein